MHNRRGRDSFQIDLGETSELGFLSKRCEAKQSKESRRGRSCWNRIAFEVFDHLNCDLL